ncbi:MAG: hypothetical protein K6C14_03215 [Eubacterium sp.]|nr:hypothetical protein [Eubacterium sp.]
MQEAVNKNKKKITAIALAVIVLVGAVTLGVVLKKQHDYNTPVQYEVKTISFTSFAYNKDLKLVAHRGFRAIAPENTLSAYTCAGVAGYWGAECDTYRTADGVWVLMHDADIKRMTDGRGKVEKMTYEELKGFKVDNGNGLENYPDEKITTLEDYLKECAAYKMKAFIELKGENNTGHYDEIIELVKNTKADAVYISFGAENLKAIRALDEKAPLFYLVHKLDDKVIQTAKELGNCGVNFNADVKDNFKDDGKLIKKISEEGLTAAAWTVDDLETMEKLISYGVLIQTTDCITY